MADTLSIRNASLARMGIQPISYHDELYAVHSGNRRPVKRMEGKAWCPHCSRAARKDSETCQCGAVFTAKVERDAP